jgi:hypothetical protein
MERLALKHANVSTAQDELPTLELRNEWRTPSLIQTFQRAVFTPSFRHGGIQVASKLRFGEKMKPLWDSIEKPNPPTKRIFQTTESSIQSPRKNLSRPTTAKSMTLNRNVKPHLNPSRPSTAQPRIPSQSRNTSTPQRIKHYELDELADVSSTIAKKQPSETGM